MVNVLGTIFSRGLIHFQRAFVAAGWCKNKLQCVFMVMTEHVTQWLTDVFLKIQLGHALFQMVGSGVGY